MSKLFIYYSLTGNGDSVADILSGKGYEIRKVIEKKKMPKSFLFRIMAGGFRAGINAKGKLVGFDNNLDLYDEIIIGSPVWNARLTPAINSVLSQVSFIGKKVTFVLYSGSGTGPKAVKKINKLFPTAEIVLLKEPKSHPEELEKLNNIE